MARLQFNAATVDPQKPLEVIPADWYPVYIIASDFKPTKDATGSFLEIEMEIIGGQYKGTKLYDRFNLQNNSQKAVEIAYRSLSAVCHATGIIQCEDSQQLHGRPMMAKVSVSPASQGKDGKMYDAKNEVDGYKAMEQGTMGNMGTGQPAAPAWANGQSAPSASAPAWMNPASSQPQVPAATPSQPWQQPTAPVATPPGFDKPWTNPTAATPPATGGNPPWMNPAGAQSTVQPPQQPSQPWNAAPPANAPAAGNPPWMR